VRKPTSVDEYLSWVPEGHRPYLDAMRATIHAVAPQAEEVISYGMPAFRLGGKFFCSYSDFKNHVSLFPATEYVRERLGDEVAPYFAGKGTFQFRVDRPIPTDLITRIVRLLVEEKATVD
jgi:uncharacterized protein YdhG (YjbR/CyaY superfamily)